MMFTTGSPGRILLRDYGEDHRALPHEAAHSLHKVFDVRISQQWFQELNPTYDLSRSLEEQGLLDPYACSRNSPDTKQKAQEWINIKYQNQGRVFQRGKVTVSVYNPNPDIRDPETGMTVAEEIAEGIFCQQENLPGLLRRYATDITAIGDENVPWIGRFIPWGKPSKEYLHVTEDIATHTHVLCHLLETLRGPIRHITEEDENIVRLLKENELVKTRAELLIGNGFLDFDYLLQIEDEKNRIQRKQDKVTRTTLRGRQVPHAHYPSGKVFLLK